MLTKLKFSEILRPLELFYGKKLAAEQLSFYYDRLGSVEEQALLYSFSEVMENEKSFPTPKILKNYLQAFIKRPEASFSQEQRAITRPPKNFGPEYEKKCISLYSRFSSGKLNWEDCANEMAVLEKEYPGIGWLEYAKRITARHLGLEYSNSISTVTATSLANHYSQ